MIYIHNVQFLDNSTDGLCLYEVGVNNHPPLFTFEHRRSEGLAKCLYLAAQAANLYEYRKWHNPDPVIEQASQALMAGMADTMRELWLNAVKECQREKSED